jgi:hypothetical protein
LATLAAIGSASGNLLFAGLSAVPVAGMTAFDTLGSVFAKQKSKQDELLELPMPPWWTGGLPSWQGLCSEIGDHLPDIFRAMAKRLQQERGVVTTAVIRKVFIDVLADEPLIWESDSRERRHIAEYIATPVLEKSAAVLKTVLEPIREDTALTDIHTTAANSEKMVEVLERAISVLEKVHQEVHRQGEQATPAINSPATPTAASTGIQATLQASQDNSLPADTLQRKIASDEYDVFICYNTEDELAVMQIGKQLKARGILPWFDEVDQQPGTPWQAQQEQQIGKIKSAAVFVGQNGIAPWQQMQVYAFLQQFVQRGCPVIPVLLEDSPKKPSLPVFLSNMTWVDFRRQEPEPMGRLLWGITGKREFAG